MKKIAITVAASVPPITPVPIEWRLLAEAPVAMASGTVPRTNANEVMTIGRSRSRAASDGGVEERLAFLLVQLHRELDDQDRVLRRESDQRQQADLEVEVVGDAAQRDRDQRAENRERHGHHDADRQRPAFVLRGQDQEHEDQPEHEGDGGGGAGADTSSRASPAQS